MKTAFSVVLCVSAILGSWLLGRSIAIAFNAYAADAAEAAAPAKSIDQQLAELRAYVNEIRWDVDDLKIKTRDGADLELCKKMGGEDPASAVLVSGDYPKWRLPYGVKIDDQRPPEVLAADIEKCKAGKGIAYMWMSFDQPDGRECRVYFTKVDYKDPKE